MPGASNRIGLAGALVLGLLLASVPPPRSMAQSSASSPVAAGDSITITNLAQLCRALSSEERLYRSVRLELVVCASSRPSMGMLVVQDATGVELLELGGRAEQIAPGERIRLEGNRLFLRRRELGTQISAAPVVDNDGLHGWRVLDGDVVLKAGPVPLELDWFNCLRNFALEAFCQQSNQPRQMLAVPVLWHARSEPLPGETNSVAGRQDPGLRAEAYEGYWEKVPDFDLLRPVKAGITTNCDLGFRSGDELVGLRFTGFFEAPSAGKYTFRVGSDDGSLLFIGRPEVPVGRMGTTQVPAAHAALIGQPMSHLEERCWLSVHGRVSFISRVGDALEVELRSGVDTLSVKVADASGLEPAVLLNTYVRAVGVGRAALSAGQRIVLDRLLVPDGRGLTRVEPERETPGAPLPLVNIRQVQTMSVGDAPDANCPCAFVEWSPARIVAIAGFPSRTTPVGYLLTRLPCPIRSPPTQKCGRWLAIPPRAILPQSLSRSTWNGWDRDACPSPPGRPGTSWLTAAWTCNGSNSRGWSPEFRATG
jgi:hypothetical protein